MHAVIRDDIVLLSMVVCDFDCGSQIGVRMILMCIEFYKIVIAHAKYSTPHETLCIRDDVCDRTATTFGVSVEQHAIPRKFGTEEVHTARTPSFDLLMVEVAAVSEVEDM
jgi:hypothetical protein